MKLKKLLVILMLFILISCGHASSFKYDKIKLSETIVTIEIVEVFDNKNGILNYNKINDVNNLENMIEDLCTIEFIHTLGRPQVLIGVGIKLNYSNGFEILCKDAIELFNEKFEWIDHKDIYQPKGFEDLIKKYIV